MNSTDLHAAFGNHPSRHRAVDSAGQEQRRVSVGPDRHTAHRRDHLHIQVGHIADLYIDHVFRIMHVHLQIRIGLQNPVTGLLIDRRRIHRIALVAPPRIDLESSFQILCHFHSLCADCVKVLLRHFHRRTHAVYAENFCHPADAFFKVRESAYKNPPVVNPYFRAQPAYRVPDLPHKRPDKVRPVQSLQENLPIPYQQ